MDIYSILLWSQIIIAPLVLLSLLFITAPYGRHNKPGWGWQMNNRTAWIMMEFPAVATIMIVYLLQSQTIHISNIVFLLIWEFHYLYRTFYFPFQLKQTNKNFPFSIVLSAIVFNVMNGFINGYFLFVLRPLSDFNYFSSMHFFIGIIIFFLGFMMHFQSDRIILSLRKNSSKTYSIPRGVLFKYVTNPNYLGEFIQWCGWAILTWSLPGVAFALFTFCNLFPRAVSNHKWYHEKFSDYPNERKRFFPFVY